MILSSLFKGNSNTHFKYANFMNGSTPIFSQFGRDVYASDVVQMCIDIIATECSKLTPKHIRRDKDDMQVTVNSSINRLFKFAPNPLMTTRDFIEKVIWTLYMNYNCFIYPVVKWKKGANGDIREYTAFYPLNPCQVDFLQDLSNKLYVKFHFENGKHYTIPYCDVIHLRKKYSVNDIMGGGLSGMPDNEALLKVLQINDSVLQGLEKGIKTSLSIRGLLKINTMLENEELKKKREEMEKDILDGKSGILPLDLKSEYSPIKVDPKLVDEKTLDFLQKKVLYWYGMSLPILSGDFTDEQYQAFYEKTLEPVVIGLGQAFSKTIFTDREIDHGNEIVFYQQKLLFTNVKNKIAVADILGNRGALSNNKLLELFGYPPYMGGEERYMSLNYVNTKLADQYQLNKAKAGGNKNGEEKTTD